jgi:hypothetical protein
MDKNIHKKFRSGFVVLLYLVKFSRPDISSAVREIAKAINRPTEVQVKNLYRIIKYVVNTKDYGLLMNPQNENNEYTWEMKAYCDSDFAESRDRKKSVLG